MSHCTPEAALKPKRFEFTPKTVITDVFIAQVYWEAVPKTWPGGSKASITECVVRPWNSIRSVSGRAESTSWTFRNQVVSQVWRCLAGHVHVHIPAVAKDISVWKGGHGAVWTVLIAPSKNIHTYLLTYLIPITIRNSTNIILVNRDTVWQRMHHLHSVI